MDDRSLERLVRMVAAAFPDDLDSQREAWEFLEAVLEPVDTVVLGGATEVSESRALVEAILSTGRKLASAVMELVAPMSPALTLGTAAEPVELALDPALIGSLLVEPVASVEQTLDGVDVVVRPSGPGELSLVVVALDEAGVVHNASFTRVGVDLAIAHLSVDGAALTGIAVALS